MSLPIMPANRGGFSEAMQGFQDGEDVTTQITSDAQTMADPKSTLQECITAYQDIQSLLSTDESKYGSIDPDFVTTFAPKIQSDIDALAKTINPQITDLSGKSVTLTNSTTGNPATLYDIIQAGSSSDQNFTFSNIDLGNQPSTLPSLNWVDSSQVLTELKSCNFMQWVSDTTNNGENGKGLLSWELSTNEGGEDFLQGKGNGTWVLQCATSSGGDDSKIIQDLQNA